MDERERRERNRVPDDFATPGESATIHRAMKAALKGIAESHQVIRCVRISNETQDALESLERARRELDEFIRRED